MNKAKLNGGRGKDTLDGGVANDRLDGDYGPDREFGGPGKMTLSSPPTVTRIPSTAALAPRIQPTADFSVVDPHRMMRTYGPAKGFTQRLVHAWRVWVNINAIRCKSTNKDVVNKECENVWEAQAQP